MSDQTAYFRGRYVDILLTALEALLNDGDLVARNGWSYVHPHELCDRIERRIDAWSGDLEAPWLDQIRPAAPESTQGPPEDPAPDETPVPKQEADEPEPEPRDDPGSEATEEEPDDEPAQEPEPDEEPDDLEAAREREDWPHHRPYPGPIQPRVLKLLREFDEPLTKEDIYEGLDQKQGVGAQLARMVTSGELTLNDDGFYSLAPEPNDEDAEDPNPDPATVEVEDPSDRLVQQERADYEEERILDALSGEAKAVTELVAELDMPQSQVGKRVRELAKRGRIESHGMVDGRARWRRKLLPEEDPTVTIRLADRTGTVEGRALAQLEEHGRLSVEQLAARLVLHPRIVRASVEALIRRGDVEQLPGGVFAAKVPA